MRERAHRVLLAKSIEAARGIARGTRTRASPDKKKYRGTVRMRLAHTLEGGSRPRPERLVQSADGSGFRFLGKLA